MGRRYTDRGRESTREVIVAVVVARVKVFANSAGFSTTLMYPL
jgi:hypothetical protein